MKLTEQEKLVINQPATVKIFPEEQDDLWLLYNLISSTDTISAETTRKVHQFGAGKSAVRVKFTAEVRATVLDYDRVSSTLRVKGKTATTSTYVPAGAFHTIEIELNKPFWLRKKSWDRVSIETLKSGCNRPIGADITVLLMNQSSARLYLVGRSTSNLCASVDYGGNRRNLSVFFENVFHAFRKHVDFTVLRCMVIGGPGNTKDEFRRYLLSESKRLRLKSFDDHKSRIVLVDVDCIDKEGLKQVLCDSGTMNLIKDTKSAMEVKAMKDLNDMLFDDSDRACYGPKSVDMAQGMMAIETLLITDDLLKSRDVVVRQKYYELVNSVKKAGGKTLIYSSVHVSGEQLAQLTGVAAILRFPLPDIDDLEL